MRAAVVTPLSGPLAGYGQASADALALWAEQFAAPEPRSGVDLTVFDAHPDVADAVRRAERERPELLFGPYGSGPARRAASATSRLMWNHGGACVPREAVGSAGAVVDVLSPADAYFDGAVRAVQRADSATPRVSVLHGPTRFARAVGNGVAHAARRCGLPVAAESLGADPPQGEVLFVAGRFEEERAAVRALDRRAWRAVGFVGAGVREVLTDLGAQRAGLLGPTQWLPELAPRQPDLGPTAEEFVSAYRARTGTEPPYPATQAFAAGLVAHHCLQHAADTSDAQVLAAAQQRECTTLFGRFRLDEHGRQTGHQVLTVQWQDDKRVVVWPPESAQASLRYPLS